MDAQGGFATPPELLGQLHEPRSGDVIGVWALPTHHGDVDDSARVTVRAHTSRGLCEITVRTWHSGRTSQPQRRSRPAGGG
jgi:hypothetical protein